MPEPLHQADRVSVDWQNHLRDRLSQFDKLLAEFLKYRTALAVSLETGPFISVMDEADMNELQTLVSDLAESFDWQIIQDFWK